MQGLMSRLEKQRGMIGKLPSNNQIFFQTVVREDSVPVPLQFVAQGPFYSCGTVPERTKGTRRKLLPQSFQLGLPATSWVCTFQGALFQVGS